MSAGVPEGVVPPDRYSVRPRGTSATDRTDILSKAAGRTGAPAVDRWGLTGVRRCPPGQNTLTPYAFSASVTGWKKVVPPEVQLPLPPEVRPIARVPE